VRLREGCAAGRATIWKVNPKTGEHRIYASGLRNPNGLNWSPGGALWTAVNERDEIGGDLVPDYMTAVKKDGFYGWPWSYYGQHVDDRVKPQNPSIVATAIVPITRSARTRPRLGWCLPAEPIWGRRFRPVLLWRSTAPGIASL
jgi:glucose/arabinose dehydrogenase